MGYIQIAKGIPEFSKAVISFWFRVPKASMDKVREAQAGDSEASKAMAGIIPLLVMGKRGTGEIPYRVINGKTLYYNTKGYLAWDMGQHIYTVKLVGVNRWRDTFTYNPNAHIEPVFGTIQGDIARLSIDGEAPPTAPTVIGVGSDGRLFVNFETNKAADVTGSFIHTGTTPGSVEGHTTSNYYGPVPSPPGEHDAYPIGTYIHEYDLIAGVPINDVVIEDTTGWQPWPVTDDIVTKAQHRYTDIASTTSAATQAIVSDLIAVAADHWHHVLISVELKTIATRGNGGNTSASRNPISQWVESAAKLYVAFDDVNYTGFDLSLFINDGSEDKNEILTRDAWGVAGTSPATGVDGNNLGNPSYSLSDPKIVSNDSALGLPASVEYVENIYKVEMAELQVFTGVTLDTDKVKNRRAFVDKDGVPVPPLPKVDANGSVVPMPSAQVLGKNPEIVLHGSGNWARGYNTGTLGIDAHGKPIKAGQFAPKGEIKSWQPDPTLHGPQGPQSPRPPPPEVPSEIRLMRKPVAVEQD